MLIVRIVQDVYGLADAFWLGRYNQYAVAIPRQTWPLYTLFTAFLMGFSSANLAILSQYVGAGMYRMVIETTGRMLFISLVSGGAFGALFYVASPCLLELFVRIPSEMLADATGYAQVMSIDVALLSLNVSLAILLQSLGDTKTVALSQALGAVSNVLLDPVLIGGFGPIPPLGAVGAAVATVLSKAISTAMLAHAISKRYSWIRLGVAVAVDREYIATSIGMALPIFLMNVSNALAFNLQNRLANTFGAVVATAFSIGFVVFDLANTGLWGLTEGIAIMVGLNLGANNIERSKAIAKKTSLFIFALVAASSAAVYLAKDFIATAFITGYGIDPSIADAIRSEYDRFVSMCVWTLAFFALTFSAVSVGRGSGHVLAPTAINILRLWGLRVGLGYLLALALGLNTIGIYVAFALSNVVGGLVSALWIFRGSWARPIVKANR